MSELIMITRHTKVTRTSFIESRPGLEFTLVEQKGPVHMPTFVIHVTLNDQLFVGTGRYERQRDRPISVLDHLIFLLETRACIFFIFEAVLKYLHY
jgi:hypothetical protein